MCISFNYKQYETYVFVGKNVAYPCYRLKEFFNNNILIVYRKSPYSFFYLGIKLTNKLK